MTKQQHDKIAQAIINNPQRSYTQLSADLGCSRITVARVAKDAGITRPRGKKLNLIDKYAKEDLVWPLERYPSGRFRTHHDTCQYPNGVQDDVRVFCGGDAVQEVEGYLFCSLHAPMAERGCLDIEYTDGTTPRGIIESAEQP